MTDVVAVDLGNESGRIFNITFDGRHVRGAEVYRFRNNPVTVRGTLYWDMLRLWHEIQIGLGKALETPVSGIGVDSFGVDFGLLDRNGDLIGNPVHMRDNRTDGMMDWVFARVSRDAIFERTGIGFYVINTLYQLAAIQTRSAWQFEVAETLLTVPNLINYWLTGEKLSEFTHTTTTQCFNPHLGDWDRATLDQIGVPTRILPPVVQPGEEVGRYEQVSVYTVASHDTGSAVVAIPTETTDYAYISSGTWSLFGMETRSPIITPAAMRANLTSEGGAYGTFRPLVMVMGMWLVQQCREVWSGLGLNTDYAHLLEAVSLAAPFRSLIDPDDPIFFPPGDMPARIANYCVQTGQPVPETPGMVLRCIFESLALKYRMVLENLIAVTGRKVDVLHIIGGGSQNPTLCQMTADAIKRPVLAGPSEATAIGNGLVQLIAMGEIRDLAEARRIVRESFAPARYEPSFMLDWNGAYEKFKKIVGA